MYPSLLYPAFSKYKKLGLFEEKSPKKGQKYTAGLNRKNQELITERRFFDASTGKLYTSNNKRNTRLRIDCVVTFENGVKDTFQVDRKKLFYPVQNNRSKFLAHKKFWNYPTVQNTFIRKGVPYSDAALAEVAVYFLKNLRDQYSLKEEQASDITLVFNRISYKTKRVVHQSAVVLK